MKINSILKYFSISILIIMQICNLSCEDTLQKSNEQNDTIKRSEGIPMVFNGCINDCDTLTRAENYEWQDGATLVIVAPELMHNDNPAIFAVYTKETGWIAYGLTGLDCSEHTCYVGYSESWIYDTISIIDENRISSYANHNGRFKAKSTGGYYCSLCYDEEGKPQENASCSLNEGIFYLNATLVARFGRVRFVSDKPITAEHNHATYYDDAPYYDKGLYLTYHGVSAASTDFLEFHQEPDGKYYSNYIYSIAVPEIKIGDYVYKYRGKRVLTPGKSACITLPTSSENTSNWICEKYFEILDNEEITLTFVNGQYYQQSTHILSSNPGDIESNDDSIGKNMIESAVGLNVEICYRGSATFIGIEPGIYQCLKNEHQPDDNNYELCLGGAWWQFYYGSVMLLPTFEEKLLKLHNCHTEESNYFCPYLYFKDCRGSITIFYYKISNF